MNAHAPSIGRIVHYVCNWEHTRYYDQCLAAVISGIRETIGEFGPETVCDLHVFVPGESVASLTGVKYAPEPKLGFWSWPQRVV